MSLSVQKTRKKSHVAAVSSFIRQFVARSLLSMVSCCFRASAVVIVKNFPTVEFASCFTG